jgi:hypothetical protein
MDWLMEEAFHGRVDGGGCRRRFEGWKLMMHSTEPQVLPHEAKARQSPKAKQTYSSMDSIENW